MNDQLCTTGATALGIAAACFVFALVAVAGESMERRTRERIECLHLSKGETSTSSWPSYCQAFPVK